MTPREEISTFRKKISFNYYLVIAVLSIAVVLSFFVSTPNVVLKHAVSTTGVLLVIIIIQSFVRRKHLLEVLHPDKPDQTIEELQKLLEQDIRTFKGTSGVRLVIGFVLMVAMIFLIIYKPGLSLTGSVAVTWLVIILYSMMKSWSLMKDQMMLQDIKHSMNDHTSAIS